MLYNHTICLQNGGYPMKKQAIALLLAAVLVLSGCGRQQLPEETPADMGLAAVAAIESHTPPALELTEAQTPPEEPVEEPEEPEEPDWSAGSSDYPWVRSGYAYYIRVNRSANVVTVYTAGDDGRYSVPYRAMVCSSGGSGTPLGDFSLDGWCRWEWLGLVGGVSGQYCTQIYSDYLFHSSPIRSSTTRVPSSRGSSTSWEPAAPTAVSACRWRTPSGSMTTSTTSPE